MPPIAPDLKHMQLVVDPDTIRKLDAVDDKGIFSAKEADNPLTVRGGMAPAFIMTRVKADDNENLRAVVETVEAVYNFRFYLKVDAKWYATNPPLRPSGLPITGPERCILIACVGEPRMLSLVEITHDAKAYIKVYVKRGEKVELKRLKDSLKDPRRKRKAADLDDDAMTMLLDDRNFAKSLIEMCASAPDGCKRLATAVAAKWGAVPALEDERSEADSELLKAVMKAVARASTTDDRVGLTFDLLIAAWESV
jgi:hypothetical protein